MNEFLNTLLSFDTQAFYFINHSLQNWFFDFLMPIITDLNHYRVIIVAAFVILVLMIIRGKSNVRLGAILLVLAVAFSDQLNSFVLKFLFSRPRPCHVLQDVHLLVGCGGGFSFPSSHAANNFAGALVLAYCIPRYRWWFWSFATLVAFSRIYVGVHYPLDVIGGAIVGMACGSIVIVLYLLFERLITVYKVRKYQTHINTQ
ncbi:MAG: phosphatase PAP2 family protein [Bacteroidetes bacterium]|jgi:undecaprenyl-diphosphatase|nr:phosphatase PAP2 family protein [Bacteroidota bacterium]